MSNYFEEAWQEAMKDISQKIQDAVNAMRPVGSWSISHDDIPTGYIIDSTATVIDENVKALPVPMQEASHERDSNR